MQPKKIIRKLLPLLLIGTLFFPAITAVADNIEKPKLVIIIDNLGDQEAVGIKVANLPGQVACSIIPHARFSAKIAELCHEQNKSVILNTPMQALNNYPLGVGGLHMNMPKAVFIKTLTDDIASVPYIQGLDNHMGSLLTAQTVPMNWIMETIKPHGLFFLDNKTSPHSVVGKVAQANRVPFISRDIFLDDQRTPQAIHKQFTTALKIAKRYGVAVIVAHPYPVTLNYLQNALPQLATQGYQLVSIPQALNVSIEPINLATKDNNLKENKIDKTKPDVSVTPVPAKTVVMNIDKPVLPKPVEITPPVKPVPVKEKPVEKPVEQPKEKSTEKPAEKIVEKPAPQTKEQTVTVPLPVPITAPIDKPLPSVAAPSNKAEAKPPAEKKAKQESKKEPEKIAVATTPPVSKNNTVAAKATAQASHSLLENLKQSVCEKYPHFCDHHKANNNSTAETAVAFDQLQGKLKWPTQGNIITAFGSEVGGSDLKYNGVLIQAPAGQPVHAVSQGKVIFANWLQGLGLLLIIDHGNGYMSLYGHNAALYKKAGDTVKPAELIAAVGNSGIPGPTGLYFEIRHNGQPVNPVQWCG